jgi:hypothetical protein
MQKLIELVPGDDVCPEIVFLLERAIAGEFGKTDVALAVELIKQLRGEMP